MCQIKWVLLLFAFLLSSSFLWGDSFVVTESALEGIRQDVQIIQLESTLLRAELRESRIESEMLQAQLQMLDQQLMRSEEKLQRAAQSLEISEMELIKLMQEIATLKNGLKELQTRADELNSQSMRLKRWNRILLGAGVVLAAGVIGLGVYVGGG